MKWVFVLHFSRKKKKGILPDLVFSGRNTGKNPTMILWWAHLRNSLGIQEPVPRRSYTMVSRCGKYGIRNLIWWSMERRGSTSGSLLRTQTHIVSIIRKNEGFFFFPFLFFSLEKNPSVLSRICKIIWMLLIFCWKRLPGTKPHDFRYAFTNSYGKVGKDS